MPEPRRDGCDCSAVPKGIALRDRTAGPHNGAVVTFSSVAPVLPVRHLAEAVACYKRLGFAVQLFEGGDYAFASRGEVNLHLATVERNEPDKSTVAVFLYVSDAHALHDEWTEVVVEGRLVPPVDTDYGLVEGAYVDPDGNLLRFGSPLSGPSQ